MKARLVATATLLAVSACGPAGSPPPTSSSASSTPSTEYTSPFRSPMPAAPLATASHGYTPTAIVTPTSQTDRFITTPQLRGGNLAVAERFNGAMRASVAGQPQPSADMVVNDGGLEGGYRSGVTRIGSGAVAGRTVLYWNGGGAHPNYSMGTVVIATRTATPITVDDLYSDRTAAPARLRTLLPQLDASLRLTRELLSDDRFANIWLPTSAGLEVYVPVAHVIGDFVPVVVPWDRIADLLRPGMLETLRAD